MVTATLWRRLPHGYVYANCDVAHGTRTKKKGDRLRGGRTRHAAACAGPDPLAAPMGGARKLGRGRAQVCGLANPHPYNQFHSACQLRNL